MIATTNDSEFISNLDGKITKTLIKILGKTDYEIAIQIKDPVLNRDIIVLSEFDNDYKGYWVYNSQFDIKEHFIIYVK